MSLSGSDAATMISVMFHAIPEIVIVELHNSYYLSAKIIILPTHLSLDLYRDCFNVNAI